MQLILQVASNDKAGPILRLPTGQYVVGRDAKCQIQINQRAVSREHCLLTVGPDRATVRDLASRNRTYLNHSQIAKESPLTNGDRLSVCDVAFQVRLIKDDSQIEGSWLTVAQAGPGIEVAPPPAVRR